MTLQLFTSGISSLFFAALALAQAPAAKSPAEWPHEYLRGEVIVPCIDNEEDKCIWHRLIVDNQSADTLECSGRITYDSFNREQKITVERKMVVSSHARKAVVGDTTKPEVKAMSHTVQCSVRPPPDGSKLTPKCKPTALTAPSKLDYPAESRLASEEGPVLIEFSLTDKLAAPTEIAVVGSSLWPRLDEAGVKYVSQFAGATDCKHGRFRVPVTFQLR